MIRSKQNIVIRSVVKIMSRVQEHDNENDDEIRQRLPMVCKTDYYKSTLPTSREVSIG